jgi:hypothetical protein
VGVSSSRSFATRWAALRAFSLFPHPHSFIVGTICRPLHCVLKQADALRRAVGALETIRKVTSTMRK